MIAQSLNFEPFVKLVKATAYGSQISLQQKKAYDYACDYYTEKRVALQKTTDIRVDDHTPITKEVRVSNALRGGPYVPQKAMTADALRFDYIQRGPLSNMESLYALFIHWPKATVSNERDQSIEIQDLFVRVPLCEDGMKFREYNPFTLMRTTFPRVQWNHGYIHSHVQVFDSPMRFRHICLGSGPIRNTITTLRNDEDNDEALMLFFWELDKVVHVESLHGVPYFNLSSVTGGTLEEVDAMPRECTALFDAKHHHKDALRDFLSSFFLSEEIPFAFRNGGYVLGCSFLEFSVLISNYYRKWMDAYFCACSAGAKVPSYKSHLSFSMNKYIIKDNKIYKKDSSVTNRRVPDVLPFMFNGTAFPLIVIEEVEGTDYLECWLLPLDVIASIANFVLTAVNTATSFSYEERKKEEADFWYEQLCLSISATRFKSTEYGRATGTTTTCY